MFIFEIENIPLGCSMSSVLNTILNANDNQATHGAIPRLLSWNTIEHCTSKHSHFRFSYRHVFAFSSTNVPAITFSRILVYDATNAYACTFKRMCTYYTYAYTHRQSVPITQCGNKRNGSNYVDGLSTDILPQNIRVFVVTWDFTTSANQTQTRIRVCVWFADKNTRGGEKQRKREREKKWERVSVCERERELVHHQWK